MSKVGSVYRGVKNAISKTGKKDDLIHHNFKKELAILSGKKATKVKKTK